MKVLGISQPLVKLSGGSGRAGERGFSLIELMMVVAVMGIVSAIALPGMMRASEDNRLKGDGRSISHAIALTKMRAASKFSKARLFVDLGTNSYYTQSWDKTANAWVTEGGVIALSPGVTFGFGTLDTPPLNTQAAIQQSPTCLAGDNAGAAIANSACIVFNSRGIPIETTGINVNGPYGNNGIYITNGVGVIATTLTATPLVRLWWSPARTVAWVRQ
jgi:prepilin-type N-terminal cleavage/methylation domain-containing protein